MSLSNEAASDFASIVRDSTLFGRAVVLTDPEGNEQELTGQWKDISASLDPDTGQLVSCREASVTLVYSDLTEIPTNTPDQNAKPWQVLVDDVRGDSIRYKVRETIPDRVFGSIVLMLELYDCGG